jgi:phospholipid-binding lipoprotein MlaA
LKAAQTLLLPLMLCGALSGCATPGTASTRSPEDPWENFNRNVYAFNDSVDRWTLKPVAKAYEKVLPQFVRTGIGNFFDNFTYGTTIVNQLLQGKPGMAARDAGRLLLNTVFGIGGLVDVASEAGFVENDEDFGQTLAVWGVPSGPFLVLPFLGPSSVRDAPSSFAEYFVDPLTYTDVQWEIVWGVRALEIVDARASLLPLDPTLERTFDPYVFVRDAWLQRRLYQIYDGDPPIEPLELEDEWLDEEEASGEP